MFSSVTGVAWWDRYSYSAMKKVIRAWKESRTGSATKTYRCQEINLSWCICADIKKLFVRLSIYHGCINQRKDSGKYFWPLYRLPWFGQQHNKVTHAMFYFVQNVLICSTKHQFAQKILKVSNTSTGFWCHFTHFHTLFNGIAFVQS